MSAPSVKKGLYSNLSPVQMEEELERAEDYMNSDKPLTPRMISELMHVGVTLHTTIHYEKEREESATSSILYGIGVALVSVSLAVAIGSFFLYTYQIGPFHNQLEAAR